MKAGVPGHHSHSFGADHSKSIEQLSSGHSTTLLCKDVNADAEDGYRMKKEKKRQQQHVIVFTHSSV
jgi:hypothetical protein